MLALAIATVFTLTGILTLTTLADSVIKGRNAYRELMAEGALLRAGYAVQIEARELRLRRSPHRTERREIMMRWRPVPACAAA
jgi:uncharacterized protein YoaH (UPF0181 family)